MRNRWFVPFVLIAALSTGAWCSRALAQATDAQPPEDAAPAATPPPQGALGDLPYRLRQRHWHPHDHTLVSIGHDTVLPKGAMADAVVSVFGSSTSDGEVSGAVVSVFGDSRASGSVGDSVVAVLGDVYVNGKVANTVVAVLGDVELGPQAEVNGEVVTIGGTLRRDASAVVRGGVEEVMTGTVSGFRWLRPWIQHCLLYARPLALAPGLGWAWGIALSFLALYLVLALAFREGVDRCVATLEAHPGRTLLASILVMLLTPWVLLLLTITVIGMIAVPFVLLLIACAALFGKAVILSWIGRRCLSIPERAPPGSVALAVLTGGAIVLLLYLVPVLGAIVFNVLGMLAVGVVVYTLILQHRARPAAAAPAADAGAHAAAAGAAAAAAGAAAAASAPAPEATAPRAGAAFQAAAETPAPEAAPPPPPPPPPGAPPSATSVAELAAPRAGFWIRMAALALDAILIGVLLGFVHRSAHLELLALAAYGAVMWKLKGTTIGGIVCNLKVVRVDGRPIDWPTAIVRALSCFLSLAAVGLGFLWIVLDDERQAWHDKIAGTVVVQLPKGVSLL